MRKYHQLLLLLLSVISFFLLLVYRHEYNRLHYVLEVFNFFGQPCNVSDLLSSGSVISHHDWGPQPIWTLDQGVEIYSTFINHNGVESIVHVDGQKHAKSCYLYYEDERKIIGRFGYSQIGNGVFLYKCEGESKKTHGVSYGIRGVQKHAVNHQTDKVEFNVTVCGLILSNATKREFIEFISFHSLVGVDSFIFYTNSLPYNIIKLVTNISPRLNISVTFYTWNKPDEAYARTVVEADCTHRAKQQSKYTVILSLNEYLVPFYDSLLDTLSAQNDHSNDRLSIPMQKFCVIGTKTNKPIALQNPMMTYDDNNPTLTVYKNYKEGNLISSREVDKKLLSVHKYVKCEGEAFRTYKDDDILKFSTDFIRSTFFQLMLEGQL